MKVVCSRLYGWLAANVQGVYDKFCLQAARAYIAQVSLPFVQGLLAAQSGRGGALAARQSPFPAGTALYQRHRLYRAGADGGIGW